MSSHVLFDDLLLSDGGFSVYLSVQLSMTEKLIIALHEHPTSIIVEGAFWKRNYQEALDDFEDVGERPLCWVPVLLESVDADFSRGLCDVWMEYFCEEVAFRQR